MALDTFSSIAGKVVGRCPTAGVLLARDWVNQGFRRVAERKRWTFLSKYGQILFPAVYNTGTVAVTHNNTTVTGTGTTFTTAMVGRQFRIGTTTPIYTISAFVGVTEVTLANAYGGTTATGQTYEIFTAYPTVPSDFNSFIVAIDPGQNRRLWVNKFNTIDLDAIDPQRSTSGNPYTLVFRDYDTSSPPLPRYEAWPHVKTQSVIPFMYEIRATDLDDSGAVLPRYIRGDMLMEYALWQAALWPGPEGRKNPYFNMGLADRHRSEFERQVAEAERQDEERFAQDVTYAEWYDFPYAPWPFPTDARYLQNHAVW